MIEATFNCHTFKLYSAVLSAFWERRWNNLVIDRYMNLVGCLHAQSSEHVLYGAMLSWSIRKEWLKFSKGWLNMRTEGTPNYDTYVLKVSLLSASFAGAVSWSKYCRKVCLTPKQTKQSSRVDQLFKESLYGKRPRWNYLAPTDGLAQMIINCSPVLLTRHCVYDVVCFIIGS